MQTYLVTGGAGFIGANYIHYMFDTYGSDVNIINVDKLTYAGKAERLEKFSTWNNYKFIQADICDKKTIHDIFTQYDIDRVVHFAAESHVDRSIETPDLFLETNVLGTGVLLNAARKAWKIKGKRI